MNQTESETTQLLAIMQEMLKAVRLVCSNQEKLSSEQQHLAKAMGEVGLLLTNHGGAIAQLFRNAGLPLDDESTPPTMTN